MTIKATSRIGLPAGSRDVRLERVDSDTHHYWRLWLSYDRNMEFGTYLMLHDNGAITRITVHPDGWEQTMAIKPPSTNVPNDVLKEDTNIGEKEQAC